MSINIITIDPAHFHAALIHKEMVPGIDPLVHVFAPLGPDLMAHLNRLMGFNTRGQNPTRWDVEVHASDDFLARLLRNPPGNVAVLAGRNYSKIDTMLACAEAGLHILADKPWIIRHADMPKLQRLLKIADEKRIVIFDIMTERHEATSMLQQALVQDREIFGEWIAGAPDHPAIEMESIHALKKHVAGVPLQRPPAFFDVAQQGEGVTDVGTHLVDLCFWLTAPEQVVDAARDVRILDSRRWPTIVSDDDYRAITGVARCEPLDYYCNNRVLWTLRGHTIVLDIRWNVELPAGDTHNAIVRGTRSSVRISQPADRVATPELDVIPNSDSDRATVRAALNLRVRHLDARFPGLRATENGEAFRIEIPPEHRIGHEAHFAQVAAEFLRYVADPARMPAWEMPNLLAKYFVTTAAVAQAS